MARKIDKVKGLIKLAGTASTQMMIGGIVAAVVPANVSIVYKVAAYVGSCVVAMCIDKPVSDVVDTQFDQIQAVVDQTKEYIDILKKDENDVTVEPDKTEGA